MENTIRTFITEEVPGLLNGLTSNSEPQWGLMDAQQMVEHVSSVFYISMHDVGLKITTPADKLEIVRGFLWNDRPMARNFFIEGVSNREPVTYKFETLDKAKTILLVSIRKFYDYYQQNPEATRIHPVFGLLNFEEWERFHFKHLQHHFSQFGLVEVAPAD